MKESKIVIYLRLLLAGEKVLYAGGSLEMKEKFVYKYSSKDKSNVPITYSATLEILRIKADEEIKQEHHLSKLHEAHQEILDHIEIHEERVRNGLE